MAAPQLQQPDLKLKKEVVYCSLIFQIVILDGRLFEAHLDKLSKLQVSDVEKSIILWKYPFSDTDQKSGFQLWDRPERAKQISHLSAREFGAPGHPNP